MAKPTAAEIAAKYRRPRRSQCLTCDLKPERLAIVRELRFEHGLSFRDLSTAIRSEWGVKIGDAAVQHHFAAHEKVAA